MEITVQLNRDDYKEFTRYVLENKKISRRFSLASYIFFICFVILVNYKKISDFKYMFGQLLFIVILLTVFLFIFFRINVFFSKYIPNKEGLSLQKKKIIIGDEALMVETDLSKTSMQWNGIQSIEENNNYIYIFIDRHMAHVIPKRFFKTSDECGEFVKSLKVKIEGLRPE